MSQHCQQRVDGKTLVCVSLVLEDVEKWHVTVVEGAGVEPDCRPKGDGKARRRTTVDQRLIDEREEETHQDRPTTSADRLKNGGASGSDN